MPPSTEGTVMLPGLDGAVRWGGSAFDPEMGYAYVNTSEVPNILKLVELKQGAGGAGRLRYLEYCATCHGADLQGSAEAAPALAAGRAAMPMSPSPWPSNEEGRTGRTRAASRSPERAGL
ncbi:MAG: hypothetical protein HYY36_02240 [Gammaproteobacteria bacterium]|nr:hypothetical protein [Gammaproteobacteria bacterium]